MEISTALASVYQNRTELIGKKIDFDCIGPKVPYTRQLVISCSRELSRPILGFDLAHETQGCDAEVAGGRESHVEPSKSYAFIKT